MATQLLVGIDIGLTGMKAVAFDLAGNICYEARHRSSQSIPKPHHVEREGEIFWADVCAMLRELAAKIAAQGAGEEIKAISIDAHGDGVWLIDKDGNEIRPGILSLDTRAIDTAAQLNAEHEADLLRVTGQNVGPASPGAVLRWLYDNERESLEKADYFILAHDYLRTRLTGTIGTDLTSASQAFTDVTTQEYTEEAFKIYGLDLLKDKGAPINNSTDIAGYVTPLAAAQTGMPEGTPVLAGMHDVDAGTVGIGAVHPGQMALMAGTWSMNVVISDAPKVDRNWFARAFINKGEWLNMSISPTGASNLEWFVGQLCATDRDVLTRAGQNPFAFVDYEVQRVADTPDRIFYLPYIYGNPMGVDASGTFTGIRAWHERGHMLAAIYEALAFNHFHHSKPLIDGFNVKDVRVSGGVAQSKVWPQILANVFGMQIGLPRGGESGALGGAMVAGVATGCFKDLDDAVAAMCGEMSFVDPQEEKIGQMRERYEAYRELIDTMMPWWEAHRTK